MADHYRFLIIGAGPTGLGAAYRLKELGQSDFLVLERDKHVGGLASSFVDDKGFTWDIGGHVQFSHYKYFDDLMVKALGADGWFHHQRESWAWMRDRFVPYPVQNNIRYFPKEQMWKALEGLIKLYQNPPRGTPKNFHEWIMATFGEGLADEFMMPYNFKVWAYPPADMNAVWVGERVAVTDLARVTKNILFEQDDLSWGPNNTFQFPKHGGTGSVWKSVGKMIGEDKIRLGVTVQAIDPKAKTVTLQHGETLKYDVLLSTMPLDLLTKAAALEKLAHSASTLKYSTSHIVGLGLAGAPPEPLKTKCWMYFPEANCPFYRTTVFSNYSPNNVPTHKPHWSLMTETSESGKKPVNREKLVEETIQGVLNTKMLESRDQIVSTWHFTAHHGYPTPSVERDAALKEVLPALEKMDVFSRGRFGAWKYEVSNQDHSMMQGVEWANRVLHDIAEVTLNFPGTANANWGKLL
jgi:protoporphyrinogen oxidase